MKFIKNEERRERACEGKKSNKNMSKEIEKERLTGKKLTRNEKNRKKDINAWEWEGRKKVKK